MKLILFILSVASIAAAQTIEVISPSEVRVDGQNFGAVADCIANHPKLASGIQRALVKWDAARAANLTTRLAEADKAKSDHKAIVEAVAKDDKEAIKQAVKSEKQRRKDEAQAKMDAAKKELEEASK